MKEESTDDLFELIKSLSRSEKRHFKLDARDSDSNYIKLFDALNSLDEYNEDRLSKKLKNEPLLLKRLPIEKNYLYNTLLKSMRSYWSEKSIHSRIKDMILNANFLLERGLYYQSEKMLRKAKKIAKDYEQTTCLLEINKLERTVFAYLNLKDLKGKFEELVTEKDEMIELLSEELTYSDFKYVIFGEFYKQKRLTDKTRINQLQRKYPIEKIESSNIKSIHGKYNGFQSEYFYNRLIGKYEEAFRSMEEIINWWEENKDFKQEMFPKYLTDLSNYIAASFTTKRMHLVPFILEKIEGEKPPNVNCQRIKFQNFVLYKTLFYLNEGLLDEGHEFILKIEPEFKKYTLTENYQITVLTNFAILFFLKSDFEYTLKWIDQIIAQKKVEKRQDVQRLIRVLKIICLFELDQFEAFDNACRSTIRYIDGTISEKALSFEFAVINYLKKISSASINNLRACYSEFKSFLESKKNSPHEYNSQGLDEYILWVDSKLSGKTMKELANNQKT